MGVKLRTMQSGDRLFALATPIVPRFGVQMIAAIDVTEIVPADTWLVEIDVSQADLDEYGFPIENVRVVAAQPWAAQGHQTWKRVEHSSVHPCQVAIDIQPANVAREQIRQIDDGEATLRR